MGYRSYLAAQRWEKNVRKLNSTNIEPLCKILNVSIDWLLHGKNESFRENNALGLYASNKKMNSDIIKIKLLEEKLSKSEEIITTLKHQISLLKDILQGKP
jgi:hypothetical protein